MWKWGGILRRVARRLADSRPSLRYVIEQVRPITIRANRMRPEVGYAYLGNGVGLTFTHRGHKILVYTRDFALSPHIILYGEWERAIEEAVLRQIKPGGTVIEVGCNMGYHTLAIVEKLGDKGQLYGFEANPELYRLLCWSLDLNGFKPRAQLYNHAVTDQPGDVTFQYIPEAVGGGNVVHHSPRQDATVLTIHGEPLDLTLPAIKDVDLLRMDAEGLEPAIIRGALNLIDRSPNIVIISEWAVSMMGPRTDLKGFIPLLTDRGFRCWRIDSDAGTTPIPIDQLLSLPHCELIFSRSDPA